MRNVKSSCETATVIPAKRGLVATGQHMRAKHLMCHSAPNHRVDRQVNNEQHTYPLGFDLLGVLLALPPIVRARSRQLKSPTQPTGLEREQMGTRLRQWAIRLLAAVALPIMLTLGLGAAANAQTVQASHVTSRHGAPQYPRLLAGIRAFR